MSGCIRQRVRALSLAAVVLVGPKLAAAEVNAWNRRGVWVTETVDLAGPGGSGPWTIQGLNFSRVGVTDVVTGEYRSGVGGADTGLFTGTVQDGPGLVLAGTILDPELGNGRFKFRMAGTLDIFAGKVIFGKGVGRHAGVMKATYDPTTLADPMGEGDIAPLRAHTAFSGAASKIGIKPGATALLVVAVDNDGPNPLPLGVRTLHLEAFLADNPAQLVSVAMPVSRVAVGMGTRRREFTDLDVPHGISTPFDLPLSVKDRTTYAVRLQLPAATTARALVVDATLSELSGASTTITILQPGDAVLRFTLRNEDLQDPVHIFLMNRPESEWFTDATRVVAGGSRTLLYAAPVGTQLRFGCGRNGQVITTCTGTVLKSGSGMVTYDPRQPVFLSLICGG